MSFKVWNFDQKPFHKNEAGSKALKTLDFQSARSTAIKEIHSQTRERWCCSTMCVSSKQRAIEGVPMEMMFQGGAGVLRSCEEFIRVTPLFRIPELNISVATSDSGSYRLEHILEWLDKALKRGPGDDGRWRILLCDVYAAHVMDPVRKVAWKHRFVMIFVGGGATGVVQTNDTHLHGDFSKAYLELEQADMFSRMQSDPHGCPSRSREHCMRDAAMCWRRTKLHLRSCEGFWANMITNALDGSEDGLASEEVAAFWNELEMTRLRKQCIEETCSDWEQGRIEWSYDVIEALIEPFPKTGHLDYYAEGQEDEGNQPGEDGHMPWNDREGPSPAGSDAEPEPANEPAGCLEEAQAQEVKRTEDRLNALALAEQAANGEVSVVQAVARARAQIRKESAGRSQADAAVAQAVRRQALMARDMDQQELARVEERRRSDEARDVAYHAMMASLEDTVKRMLLEEGRRSGAAGPSKEAEQQKARDRRMALEAAARSFKLNELGIGDKNAGSAKHQRNRFEMVQRIFALGDPLPPEIQANWKRWLERLDERGRKIYKWSWATRLRNDMAEILADLQNRKTDAALRWHRRMSAEWCLNGAAFVIPGKLAASQEAAEGD